MAAILAVYSGVTYRGLIDWLSEIPCIRQALGLKRLPHFTTVQKAFACLETAIWQVLQRAGAFLVGGDGGSGPGRLQLGSPLR